jgi:hypothetical protein
MTIVTSRTFDFIMRLAPFESKGAPPWRARTDPDKFRV